MGYNEETGFSIFSEHHNFVVIPIEIWTAKDLNWNERLLLIEIDRHTRHGRDCFITNEYISKFLGVNVTNASKTLNSLIKKGYVSKVRFDGRRRFIKSNMQITFGELPSTRRLIDNDNPALSQCDNPALSPATTIIVNEYNSKERENKNARAREEIVAEITENTQWVENQMREGLERDEVAELVNYAYDYLFNTSGLDPSKQDIVRCAHYKIKEFKEGKRIASIKAKDISERKMELWRAAQQYDKDFSYEMRTAWVLNWTKPSDNDADIMKFEAMPNFDILTTLKQWKMNDERRYKKHSTI